MIREHVSAEHTWYENLVGGSWYLNGLADGLVLKRSTAGLKPGWILYDQSSGPWVRLAVFDGDDEGFKAAKAEAERIESERG